MKMKAAVLHSTPGKLSIEEVDIADPGPNEVRVKVVASGLCHTDWETMHGYQPVNLPAVIGHEGAGVVESVGSGITRVKVGDHVACSWSPNCGHCFYCDHGQPILCEVAKMPTDRDCYSMVQRGCPWTGNRFITIVLSHRTPSTT